MATILSLRVEDNFANVLKSARDLDKALDNIIEKKQVLEAANLDPLIKKMSDAGAKLLEISESFGTISTRLRDFETILKSTLEPAKELANTITRISGVGGTTGDVFDVGARKHYEASTRTKAEREGLLASSKRDEAMDAARKLATRAMIEPLSYEKLHRTFPGLYGGVQFKRFAGEDAERQREEYLYLDKLPEILRSEVGKAEVGRRLTRAGANREEIMREIAQQLTSVEHLASFRRGSRWVATHADTLREQAAREAVSEGWARPRDEAGAPLKGAYRLTDAQRSAAADYARMRGRRDRKLAEEVVEEALDNVESVAQPVPISRVSARLGGRRRSRRGEAKEEEKEEMGWLGKMLTYAAFPFVELRHPQIGREMYRSFELPGGAGWLHMPNPLADIATRMFPALKAREVEPESGRMRTRVPSGMGEEARHATHNYQVNVYATGEAGALWKEIKDGIEAERARSGE